MQPNPRFTTRETVTSIVEFSSIMYAAGKLCVEDAVAKLDEWLCDYGTED